MTTEQRGHPRGAGRDDGASSTRSRRAGQGCRALANPVISHANNMNAIVAAGDISVVLAAMTTHGPCRCPREWLLGVGQLWLA